MNQNLATQVNNFVVKLRRREFYGAYPVALETAYLMRNTVALTRWQTPEILRDTIKQVARTITAANPLELSIGNIVRRVLYTIREETNELESRKAAEEPPTPTGPVTTVASGKAQHTSLSEIFGQRTKSSSDLLSSSTDLKGSIIESINEIIDELETFYTSISSQSLEHIHSNEIILVYGGSKTVTEFLKHAAKKRKFQVIVAEAAPHYDGQQMALSLAQAGIDTTLITDSAIFAMMARVNKVIFACHAVLANGGLLVKSGSFNVAAAAKYHSTPVVVLTGIFKLSPVHAFDQHTYNSLSSPHSLLEYQDADFAQVDAVNPIYDYIPPEYVSLFVTNAGGHSPTYLYRLLSEFYHPDDYTL